jgi:hypothetical protein
MAKLHCNRSAANWRCVPWDKSSRLREEGGKMIVCRGTFEEATHGEANMFICLRKHQLSEFGLPA